MMLVVVVAFGGMVADLCRLSSGEFLLYTNFAVTASVADVHQNGILVSSRN